MEARWLAVAQGGSGGGGDGNGGGGGSGGGGEGPSSWVAGRNSGGATLGPWMTPCGGRYALYIVP